MRLKPRKAVLRKLALVGVMSALAVCGWVTPDSASAQDDIRVRVYGFAQADYIQDFGRVDPDWEDTLRPSRIPTTDGAFGDDGNSVISIRQSRLGAEGRQQAGDNELFVRVEFDFFGVGDNQGLVTPRLRHAYGAWGPVLIGQTNSLFMDIDIFPNTIDYWGPAGMVFLRNPQFRWTFLDNERMRFAMAIENPGTDPDPGDIRVIDPNLGANIVASEEIPDLTAQFRYNGSWGHFQAAGILRNIGFETLGTVDNEPADQMLGWGIDLTGTIKVGERNKFLLGFVFGEGIASYMNDGGVDIAPEGAPGDLEGEAAPLTGISLYYDHYWNDEMSSSIGYSQTDLDNRSFQSGDAFHLGQYASANLLYTPEPNLLFGAEILYGRREDFDGASGDDFRVQFSGKYSFSGEF
jgi:hypothetical protein